MTTPCEWCGAPTNGHRRGRKRRFCRQSCKQRAYESRKFGMGEVRRRWRELHTTCHLCGELLDWDNPQEIVGDHMIATVWAGETTPPNVRPVHLLCNASKGHRLYFPAIRHK